MLEVKEKGGKTKGKANSRVSKDRLKSGKAKFRKSLK